MLESVHSFKAPVIQGTNLNDYVRASSVNMLKNRLDKFLVKAGYTYNKSSLHIKS